MPLIGWLLGSQFQQYITSIDHWIAFILLGFIGGKMMVEAVREWNEEETVEVMDAPIDHKNMLRSGCRHQYRRTRSRNHICLPRTLRS